MAIFPYPEQMQGRRFKIYFENYNMIGKEMIKLLKNGQVVEPTGSQLNTVVVSNHSEPDLKRIRKRDRCASLVEL